VQQNKIVMQNDKMFHQIIYEQTELTYIYIDVEINAAGPQVKTSRVRNLDTNV
jgi:hypothetical protein